MNVLSVTRFGKWTVIITICIGAYLVTDYLITKDVDSGMLAYFFLVFAGVVNSIAFLLALLMSFFSKEYKKQLLITSATILISYLTLLTVTYYMF